MKLLWFAHRDIKNPKAGGAERTIYEVGKRLSKLNIEVNLVTVNPGNLLEYENVVRVQWFEVHIKQYSQWKNISIMIILY